MSGLMWAVRNVGWYTWPLWPFALWTLYSWRSFWRRPHVLLPLLIDGGVDARAADLARRRAIVN